MCGTLGWLTAPGGCVLQKFGGDLLKNGAGAIAGDTLDAAAKSAGASAGDMVTKSLTWWTYSSGVNFESPVIAEAHAYTAPLTILLLVLGIVIAGAKVAIARRGEPLVNLTVNLVTFMLVSASAVALFAAIQQAGDAFAQWVIASASAGFGDRMSTAAQSSYTAAFGVIVISLLCLFLSFVQWVMMLFRYAGLVVLSATLPLAGAASVAQGRTDSIKKVLGWSVSLLLYKPIAALIYAIGFSTIGDSKDLITLLQGVVVLLLAVVAMPTLMSLFSWASAHASGGGGALAGALGTAGGFMMGRGSAGSSAGSGGGAAGQAADMASTGPGSQGGGAPSDTPAPSVGAGGSGGTDSGPGGVDGASVAPGGGADAAAASAGGEAAAAGGGAAAGGPYVAAAMAAKGAAEGAANSAAEAATGPAKES